MPLLGRSHKGALELLTPAAGELPLACELRRTAVFAGPQRLSRSTIASGGGSLWNVFVTIGLHFAW